MLAPQSKKWTDWWRPFIHMIVNEGSVQTTNTIESLNMHSVATGGNLKVEIENNYLEDCNFCQTILAMEMGVKYTYRDNSVEKRKIKNTKRRNDKEESHPPERRREGIQPSQGLAIDAVEDFLHEVKSNTLRKLEESVLETDTQDEDFVPSDDEPEVRSPPNKKRDGSVTSKKKKKVSPKRKQPDNIRKKADTCQVSSPTPAPPVIVKPPSFSKQLHTLEQAAIEGNSLQRSQRPGRFSLDGLIGRMVKK